LNVEDKTGDTPIHILARNGPSSLFKHCLGKSNNAWPRTAHGETLLHAAAAGNQVEIVKDLLSACADVNDRFPSGWTAIIFAPSLVMVRELLIHGANVNDASDSGWTALHRVADLSTDRDEATELATLLLSQNANTEARAVVPGWRFGGEHRPTLAGYRVELAVVEQSQVDPGGVIMDQTPLHWAADTGAVGIVKALLQSGANPSAKDSTGATAALCASNSLRSCYPSYDIMMRQQVTRLLLEARASFEDEDYNGMSIHVWAISCGLSLDWREW
jgi:ankyrin repeat protein